VPPGRPFDPTPAPARHDRPLQRQIGQRPYQVQARHRSVLTSEQKAEWKKLKEERRQQLKEQYGK
jgi:hypothetical protein